MRSVEKGTLASSVTYLESQASELCTCLPLSTLHQEIWETHLENPELLKEVTTATLELNVALRAELEHYFPRSTPLSIVLMHISQLEHIHILPKSAVLHKRNRYHVPASLLEQVLTCVRRTIRSSDYILVHTGASIAILLPDVDQEGSHALLQRVYHSINLLQPETVIPPLKRETEITLGIGSYPVPGASLEELLYQTGFVAIRITLRPAVTTQLPGIRSIGLAEGDLYSHMQGEENESFISARNCGVPYMKLPSRLSPRLKQLIPHALASELHCAPVGRDHNRLTVAMAFPTDAQAIDRLQKTTGLTIFPVACEVQALDTLLEQGW